MTDRPFKCTPWEVRSLIDGPMTQMRRTLTPQPGDRDRVARLPDGSWRLSLDGSERTKKIRMPCTPGDLLWVREVHAPRFKDGSERIDRNRHYVKYQASSREESPNDPMDWHSWPDEWTPAGRMPRWASRLTLTVNDVRIERLQELTFSDALANGIHLPTKERPYCEARDFEQTEKTRVDGNAEDGARKSFAKLWDLLYGNGAWDANPHVVVFVVFSILFNIDDPYLDGYRGRKPQQTDVIPAGVRF